ncbi:MAG: PDZ domain-containing protein, partial [Planctomycetaceae bacterium]
FLLFLFKPTPGEPFRHPAAVPMGPASVLASGDAPTPRSQPLTTAAAAPAASGWLGMTVAESKVPGRWSIVEIAPGGPAAAVGLVVGDDVTSIAGVVPRNADEVAQALTAIAAGQRVRLAIARGDQVSEAEVIALPRPAVTASRERPPATVPPPFAPPPAAQPAAAAAAPPSVASTWAGVAPPTAAAPVPAPSSAAPGILPAGAGRGRPALGVRTVPIDADTRVRFKLGDDTGAYVIGVVGDLPASRAGIPPGSVIVRLNGQPVRSPDDLTKIVTSGPVDRPIPVDFVLPGGTERRADVVLQPLEAPLERALVGDVTPQPTAVPVLQDGSATRTSRRPIATADEAADMRREVGRLRGLLDALERRLERVGR